MRLVYARHLLTGARTIVLFIQDSFDRLIRKNTPHSVLRDLNERYLKLFDRTPPLGENYPYEVHYAPSLQNAPESVHAFHLVGRAWKTLPDAPIALAYGFNAWKLGFIADYCPDVRIAFAPRKFLGLRAFLATCSMKPAPNRIYVWGYTERSWLRYYAKYRSIPLIRVEDAFLRSAELGASHSTPYSLIFDSKGLYYNTNKPNDLVNILTTYNFKNNAKVVEDACFVLDILISKRLSKYNVPDSSNGAHNFAVKARKRILIVGQVDNDAAVRLGNPNKWRMVDVVRLAKLENPNAEILYRPHPEVYRGYQRTKFRANSVAKFATIVTPDSPLLDMLDKVDHVYTISSLAGLEAVMRGIKVTTLGAPFYAGWGLTDDRAIKKSRRTLSLEELVASVYLIYPRYLADLDNSLCGFQAAAFRIVGDRKLLKIDAERANDVNAIIADRFTSLSATSLIAGDHGEGKLVVNGDVVNRVDRLFIESRGKIFQRVAATLLSKKTADADIISLFENVLIRMDVETANTFLLDLHKYRPDIRIAKLFAQLSEKQLQIKLPVEIYDLTDRRLQVRSEPTDSELPVTGDITYAKAVLSALRNESATRHLERGALLHSAARFEEALSSYCAAVLEGEETSRTIEQAADIAWQMFDFQSAYELAKLQIHLTGSRAQWAMKLYWRTVPYISFENLYDEAAFCTSAKLTYLPPAAERLEEMELLKESIASKDAVLKSHRLNFGLDIAFAQTLIELGKFEEAVDLARFIANRDKSYQAAVVLSRALAFLDQYEEAEKLMDGTLSAHKVKLVYDELLKLCLYRGDYEKAECLIADATNNGIDLGETVPRKIAFGNHRYRDAFLVYRRDDTSRDLFRAYPQKSIAANNYMHAGQSLMLLPSFGPGDEIRFACIYNKLSEYLPYKYFHIGVEPRLLSLFERSIKSSCIKFFPVQRILRNERADINEYCQIPFADLMAVMDNNAATMAANVDKIGLVTDVLADFFETNVDFSGSSYLIADSARVQQLRSCMPSNVPLIGLNWRSSVTLQSRMEHYFSVQDLGPIFENTEYQFVNLQYDDCDEELAWLDNKFPGRILRIPNLDQFNDIDGVAALIQCLDLVIAPCTTVAELSGSLNQKTFVLSNSSELQWRIRPDDGRDIWHRSMEHVQGKVYRNKVSVVEELVHRLQTWKPNLS